MDDIEHQRELHRRAQRGDAQALAELYASMLPLIKSRVGRVLRRYGSQLTGWYEPEDLMQDAYLVFHRFVMLNDPSIPLYRLVAGAFERALRTHLLRHGPPAEAVPAPLPEAEGLDSLRGADGPSAYEQVCAEELLAALPTDEDRTLVALAAAGYSGDELARRLGQSRGAVRWQRKRLRIQLAVRGIKRGA